MAVTYRRKNYIVGRASWLNNFNNNSNFNANNRNVNNHNRVFGIAQTAAETVFYMDFPRDLWQELYSHYNLELAYCRARKHKTLKPYVIEFERNLVSYFDKNKKLEEIQPKITAA